MRDRVVECRVNGLSIPGATVFLTRSGRDWRVRLEGPTVLGALRPDEDETPEYDVELVLADGTRWRGRMQYFTRTAHTRGAAGVEAVWTFLGTGDLVEVEA